MNYTGFNELATEAIEDAKFDMEVDLLSEDILDNWDDGDDYGAMDFVEKPSIGLKVRAVRR